MSILRDALRSTETDLTSPPSFRVLLVDGSPGYAERLAEAFIRHADGLHRIDHALDLGSAFAKLRESRPDVILLDLDLPKCGGLDAMPALLQQAPDIPVIVLARLGDEDRAWRATGLGAEAMLPRDRLTPELLIRSISHTVERHRRHHSLASHAQELERTRNRFLSLVVDNADAILALDRAGIIRFVNPAAERLLRSSASELLGQMFGVPVESIETTEIELRHKKDRGHILEIRVMRTLWDGERAFIVTMRDITERKRNEIALRIAKQTAEQANAMKTQFLANMSHELRTPLNCIIGFSELMLAEIGGPIQPPRYHGYMADIHKGATHLLTLINDLLDLAKAESGKLDLITTPFDLAALAHSVVDFMTGQADQKMLRIAATARPKSLWLDADERMVKQVLLNLVSNAVKFTPDGGNVSVGVDRNRHGETRIVVEDTGIGIASEQIPRAFAAFVQIENAYKRADNTGTGLGLALTKKFVELHQGKIRIDSEHNRGTTVTVTFPAALTIATPTIDVEADDASRAAARKAANGHRR